MAKTRKTSRPEWAEKPLRRGTLRLCDWCFKSRPRCQDSLRLHRGWHRHDNWKNHPEQRRQQWRERAIRMNAADISTADFFTNPELSGKLRFAVLDATGDTKHLWNSDIPAEVAAAKALFESLTAAGYSAFRVTDKKGEAGEQVRTFDPSHERLIFTPRMQGG